MTELAKILGLRLASASIVASIQNGVRDPRAIGQALGVDRILEGSMRRAGGRVRITAALIDAQTVEQLWSERYDHDLQDISAIQDEIARSVATEVAGTAPQTQRKANRPMPNIYAYAAYIYGRAKRLPPTPQNLAAALSSFEEAIKRDPKFAGGYAGTAQVKTLAYGAPALAEARALASLAESEELALKAVELDPEFGPGWALLAMFSLPEGSLRQPLLPLSMLLCWHRMIH